MLTKNLRKRFIEYFQSKDHTPLPSSSVVPHDDPTLLFTNAGMNQFKDIFLGKIKPQYSRAVTIQKSIRVGGKHNDLDNVGHTSRHMTFFEMLGNFSFGDYFKKEAIAFSWEVATQVFEFEKEKIFVSVFETDDEAYELWKEYVDESHLVRMGEADNFWSMGETGPCGPCSELYYDKGPSFGSATSPLEDPDGERFIEFWNLVFMEFNRDTSGKMTPLPNKSIDTGAGLERIVALKMGVKSVFETDVLQHIIKKIEELSGEKYNPKDETFAPAFHVIADHIRTLCFAIADGAQPSNIERGYVLRKILRRAIRYARQLNLDRPFLGELVPSLIEKMGEDYPELIASENRIKEILLVEEESFFRTLKRGGNILQSIIEYSLSSKNKQISGEDAFKLKDTYGFPIEEILLIAKDYGMSVNLEAYQLLEEEAKERSRKASEKTYQEVSSSIFAEYAEKHSPCEFIGFDTLSDEATIMAIVKNGLFCEEIHEGEEGYIILNKTPFYAEKGGQVGDQGILHHENASFEICDTQSPYTGVITHFGKVMSGSLIVSEPIVATVNETRRNRIAAYHSATHLLHYGLQKILGEHIKQAGSLVQEHYLRFDFNHHKALTKEELREIERLINQKVQEDALVDTYELSFQEVQDIPEIKQFFGDKYGNVVRVVDIGGYSKELCGGTHLASLGKIGLFKIKKESSVAAGVRRIEACCGLDALDLVYENEDLMDVVCEKLSSPKAKFLEKIDHLLAEKKELKQEIQAKQLKEIAYLADDLIKQKQTKGNITYLAALVEISPKFLQDLGNQLLEKMNSGILFLLLKQDDRIQLLIKVSQDLIQHGYKANDLIKKIAPIVGGSGGGKPDTAQAGGKDLAKANEALEHFKTIIG